MILKSRKFAKHWESRFWKENCLMWIFENLDRLVAGVAFHRWPDIVLIITSASAARGGGGGKWWWWWWLKMLVMKTMVMRLLLILQNSAIPSSRDRLPYIHPVIGQSSTNVTNNFSSIKPSIKVIASSAHHQLNISASLIHHQRSASSVHHECIMSTLWAQQQHIMSASSVHHHCINSASLVHHQHIISS